MSTVVERPFPWGRVIAAVGALGAAFVGVMADFALGTAALRVAKAIG